VSEYPRTSVCLCILGLILDFQYTIKIVVIFLNWILIPLLVKFVLTLAKLAYKRCLSPGLRYHIQSLDFRAFLYKIRTKNKKLQISKEPSSFFTLPMVGMFPVVTNKSDPPQRGKMTPPIPKL
jgi:hypothetical protein